MALLLTAGLNQSHLAKEGAKGARAVQKAFDQNPINLHLDHKRFTQPLGRISSDLRQFEASLASSNARVLAFGASTAVIGGVAKTFKELAVATIDVEKALTDVNRVFGLSSQGLQAFSKDLFNVSRKTASAFSEVSTAALEFSRQGLGAEETLSRVNDAMILVRLTGISTAQAVEDLTAVVNAYSDAALTTTEILNKIVAVEQRFAVSAADLTVAVSRTGQAAQEAGVNFDELNALVTAVQERTARGGAVIGNALKTIFTRLGRSDTLDQLERFNIAVRDVEGNILPAVDILENLARSYQTLSDTTRSALSEQVAGVYQVNILKSLLSDLNDQQGVYNKSVIIGKAATNEATEANEQLNKTLSALISQTGTSLLQLGNNLGKVTFEPVFRSLVEPFNDALKYINNLLEGEGLGSDFANGLLKGVRNVLAGPGIVGAVAVIGKVVGNTFRDISSALPAVLGITTASQNRKLIEESIVSVLQSQSNISRDLRAANGNLVEQQRILLKEAKEQTLEYQAQLNLARQLSPLLAQQGVKAGTSGLQVGNVKSGGFVPNFSSGGIPNNLRSKEIRGALKGGYTPGSVIPAPKSVGGVMNSAEKVKYVPGFSQPFINPPASSRAGMMHRQRSLQSVGVDPYNSNGYIPNFAANEYLYTGDFPLTNPSGRVITKGTRLKKAELSGFTRLFIGKANLEDFDADDVGRIRSVFRPIGDSPEYSVAGKAGLASSPVKVAPTSFSSATPREFRPVPKVPSVPPMINAASLVAYMGKKLNDNPAWRLGQEELNAIKASPNFTEEQKKKLSEGAYLKLNPIKQAFGKEYETYALNELRKIGFLNVRSAESLGLFGAGRGQTAVDAVDTKLKTFFEFKGGEVDNKNVNDKFRRVRSDPGNFDILTDHVWKNVLVANEYNEGAKSGNKVIYLNPLSQPGPRQYLKEGVGVNTKSFGPSELSSPIMQELLQEADRTKSAFTKGSFGGYIPNFAYSLKKISSGIGELSISTNQENAGMLMGEYANAFAQAKALNLQTIRGKLVRQKRQPRDPNDPVSVIKADIPQIIRGRFGESSSLHLAGQAFHFNGKTFDSDLSSQAGSLAALLTKSPNTNIELYTDLFKSKKKGSSKLSGATMDYEARKKALLGMSGGYIPNFSSDRELYRDLSILNSRYSLAKDDNFSGVYQGKLNKTRPSIKLFRGIGGSSGRWSDLLQKYGSFEQIPEQMREDRIFSSKRPINEYFIKDLNKRSIEEQLYDHTLSNLGDNPFLSTSFNQTKAEEFSRGPGKIGSKMFPISRIFSGKSLEALFAKYGEERVNNAILRLSKGGGRGRGVGFDINSILRDRSAQRSENEISLLSNGFVPNFSYRSKVMGLEKDLSGNRPIYSSSPFPHIRNSSQPTFSSAIKDHGGLDNALKDSFANQSAAGLVHKGFVPNFADFDITGTSLSSPKGGAVSHKKINAAINDYVRSSNLASKNNFVLNIELQKVIGSLGLSKQSFEKVRAASLEFAKTQRRVSVDAATKSAETVRNLQKQTQLATERLAKVTREIEVEKLKELQAQKGREARTNALLQEFSQKSTEHVDAVATSTVAVESTTKAQSKLKSVFSKVGQNLSKFATPLAIAAPFITGQLEQGLFAGRARSELSDKEKFGQSLLSTGISSISAGAFAGSFIGPWGTAIGAATGAAVALKVAFSSLKKSSQELGEELEIQKQKDQQNISAADRFISIQKELYAGFGAGLSSKDTEIASQNLRKAFNEIKDVNLQRTFLEVNGNLSELTDRLKKYTEEATRKTIFKDFLSSKSTDSAASSLFTSGKSSKQQEAFLKLLFEAQIARSTGKALELQLKSDTFNSPSFSKSRVDEINQLKSNSYQSSINFSKIIRDFLVEGGISKDDPDFKVRADQLKELFNKDNGLSKLLKRYQALVENNKKLTEKEIEQERILYNLHRDRARLSLEFTQTAADVNSQLEANEMSRKIQDDISNFQNDLAASFTDPLAIIASKFAFRSKQLEQELDDSITKIDSEFTDKAFSLFEKSTKISDKETRDYLVDALRTSRTGDFSQLRMLSEDASVTSKDPEFAEALQKLIIERNNAFKSAEQKSSGAQTGLGISSSIETLKSKNLKLLATTQQTEIKTAAIRERIEAERKSNTKLEIDAIERLSNDPANMLGRGVEGKAQEKNRYQTLIFEKKREDIESSRAKSIQDEYSKILDMQRKVLLDASAKAESNGDLEESISLKQQSLSISSLELNNQKDIAKVIEQINSISFSNPSDETARIEAIKKAKQAQQDLLIELKEEEELLKRINMERAREAKRSRSFGYGLRTGLDEIRDETDTFENRLGRSLPQTFKNGIVGALDAAINKTDDLGSALMDVASSFLKTIQNAMFEQIAGTMVNGIGASFKQKGGIIRAQSGMYISGGRTGDKNPAMLEDGEYVLNRQAVKAIGGPKVLNNLNFNQFPRFANGGSTSASANMLTPFTNLSEFGKENNPEYGAYVDSLREQEAIKEAKKAKEKALINQLIGTAISSAVSIGFSAGSKSLASSSFKKSSGLTTPQTSPRGFQIDPNATTSIYSQRGGLLKFNGGGYLPYGDRLNDSIPALLGGGEYVVNNRAVRKYGVGGMNKINSGLARFQDGGMVGSESSNSGNSQSSSSNEIEINITVHASNGKEDSAQTSSSGASNDNSSVQLAGKIKEVVLQVITNEQRTGGILDSTKKK